MIITRSLLAIAVLGLVLLGAGCASGHKPPRGVKPVTVNMEVTGYCSCQTCTGWKRNWRLRPVVATGSSKGQRKRVGVTASGTKARPGTLAADTRRFPFGTIMYVPGYGYGRVEDRGSAIQGNKLDLYFKRHRDALQWGRRQVEVQVWR